MTIVYGEDCFSVVIKEASPVVTEGELITTFGAVDLDGLGVTGIATAYGAAWVEHILPLQFTYVTMTSIEAYNQVVSALVTSEATGGISGSGVQVNSAALLKKGTGRRGRRARGRTFLCDALLESIVATDGTINADAVGDLTDAAQSFLADVAGAGCPMAIPQNEEGNTPPILPWPIVTSFVCDTKVATQRRRLRH